MATRGNSTNPRYEYQRAWNERNADKLRVRQRERYAIFRQFINEYKLERGCIDCGYNDHPAALDLDHRDPSQKRATIATMVTYDRQLLLAELAKCDVRCANCHRIKTVTQRQNRRRDTTSD